MRRREALSRELLSFRYSDAPGRVQMRANIGTKGILRVQAKGCQGVPLVGTLVVIVNISAHSYKLTFRQRIIVKPINISKLMHRMQRQNLHILKPFRRISVTLLITRTGKMFTFPLVAYKSPLVQLLYDCSSYTHNYSFINFYHPSPLHVFSLPRFFL